MDFLQDFTGLPIDFVMIVLVVLSGIFQSKYWTEGKNISGAWKTLITSFLFCWIYVAIRIFIGVAQKEDALKWFFSYVLATSLYDLFLKKWLSKYFPDNKNNP